MSGLPKSTLKVLVQGQEQDVVSRLVPPGAALTIENMYFDHQGNLVKRFGGAALATTVVPTGAALGPAWALGKHKGSLVRLGRQGALPIATWDPDHSAWLEPTPFSPIGKASASWSRGPMVATVQKAAQQGTYGNTFDHHDIAVAGGYQCVTFQEQTQVASVRIHQQLYSLTTGKMVIDRVVATSNHQFYPHVAVAGGRYACFVYGNTGILTVDVFDLQAADPSTPIHSWTTSGDIVGDSPLEIVPHTNGTQLLIAFRGQAGQFRASTVDPTTGFVTTVNLKTQASAAISANVAFCWVQNLDNATWSNGYPALVTVDANGVSEHIGWVQIDATNYRAGQTVVVDASEHSFVINVAAATASGGSGTSIAADILYHTTSGSVPVVKHALVNVVGGVTLDTNVCNVFLASRIFRDAGGQSCFMVGTPWLTQATLYALPIRPQPDSSPGNTAFPSPLCRSEVQTLYPSAVAAHLPSVASPDASTLYLTAGTSVIYTPAIVGSSVDIVKIQLRTGIEPKLPAPILGNPVEAIDSIFVPGGQLMQWDGRYYGAAGFAYAPQTPTQSTTTGGSLTTGYTYSWCAVYKRVDAQGRAWRSAPSPILQATPTAGQAFVLSTNYLQLVDQPGVSVEFYRDTQILPGVMHRLPAVIPNAHDVPGSPFATYTDTNSDASILTGELLYTTGGILPNQITPGALALAVFDNRLWFISADDPQSLWPSDPLTPPGTGGFNAGAGLTFNQDNIVDVRDDRGPMTGLGVCDGRLVIFKHDACYTIEGNGPDNTGAGSSYLTIRIAGSVGCDNPRGIVDAFDGVWFQSSSSRAQFWKLDRGTSLSYVGSGVRDSLTGLTVVGGVSLPEQSQIRWYTQGTNGTVLVYDVITQAWTTYASPTSATSAGCAISWNGVAVWSCAGASHLGIVLVETPGLYADAGDAFGQRVVLPWLQMGDLNGFQRVYCYQGIGTTVDDHLLRANLYRDLLDSDEPFTGVDYNMLLSAQPGWEWEVRFPMKLSAVKMELIGQPTKLDGVTPTAGFAFSGISIEYGTKVGLQPTVYTHRLTHS